MSKAYIVCRDVRKRFGEHEVLKGVSTEFQTGQVTVQITGAVDSFAGSTANGVTSSDYGSWGGSYNFVR